MHTCLINHLTLMSGLIYFSISRIKAAKVSFNKRCHDLVCKHNIGNVYGGYFWLCLFHITILPQNALKRDCNGKCIE